MLNSFLHALLFCSSARSGAQRLVFCSRFTTGICLRCCPVFFFDPLSFPDWDLLALLPSVLRSAFSFSDWDLLALLPSVSLCAYNFRGL